MNSSHLFLYIDPMSGAVVLQLIIAFVVGVGTFFRTTILGGISNLFRKSDQAAKPGS
jgi:hypothetical protein